MLKKNYDRIKETPNLLASIDTEALFDFWTYTVSLDSINLKDLEALKEDDTAIASINYKHRKVLSLANHEYTHFVDMTSTIFGIKHLQMMKNAYSIKETTHGEEFTFYKAKEFDLHITKLKYPKYYRVIGKVENPTGWTMVTTAGRLFGVDGRVTDESIIFVRFYTFSGEEIARCPISPIAILEASAMANEIITSVDLLNKLSGDAFEIQNGSFSERILKTIYDKNLTEYTACVHFISIHQNCKDILQAFVLVTLICKIILNSSEGIYEKILEKNKFKDIFHMSENQPMCEAIKNGLVHRNMGMLFYLIAFALPENSYQNILNARKGISISLRKLGIDMALVKKLAQEDFEDRYNDIIQSDIEPIKQLAVASKLNFEMIKLDDISFPFNELHLPKVVLGDFDEDELAERFIYKNDINIFQEYNVDESTEILLSRKEWVNRFSEGCI